MPVQTAVPSVSSAATKLDTSSPSAAVATQDAVVFDVRDVQFVPQPRGVPWCWAAVSQAITQSINPGHAMRMCRHAETAFNKGSCCDPSDEDLTFDEIDDDCEKNAWPRFNHKKTNYEADRLAGSRWPKWEEIKAELKERPFAVTEQYDDDESSAHMKLAFGRVAVGASEWLATYDPQDRIYGWFRWETYKRGDNGLFKPSRLYYNVRLKRTTSPAGESPGEPGGATASSADLDDVLEGEETPAIDQGPQPERDAPQFSDGSPSLADAKIASLNLLKKMADSSHYALFGFMSREEVADADWCPPESAVVEVWKRPQAHMFNYCAGGLPRGALAVAEFRKKSWSPYRIITRLPADAVAERAARAFLAKSGQQGTLVWMPALGVYLLRTEVGGMSKYVPLRAVGTLKTEGTYAAHEISRGVEKALPRPPLSFKRPTKP